MRDTIEKIESLSALYKTAPDTLVERARQQMDELREAKRAIEQFKAKESAGGAESMLAAAKSLGGLHIVTAKKKDLDANALRQMGDVLRDKDAAVVALIASVSGDKITLQCVCGKDAVAKGIRAGDIIKTIAPIVSGRGGGKPDSAMGGGTDLGKLDEALAAVEKFVSEKI